MSVTLEPVQQQELPIEPETAAEPAAEVEQQEPAAEVEQQEPAAEAEQEPVQPPKRRGRPKAAPKAAAPKAAAPKAVEPKTPKAKAAAPKRAVRMKPTGPTMSSSDDDDEVLTRDDMETLLLDYLVKRKTSQQNARRNMWAQLAGLS